MNFFEAVETCLTKYATFRGRAPRSEYWWFFLFNLIVSAVARMIPLLGIIIPLAMLLPNMAVSVRRLHDTDRSSWFLLLPAPAVVILIVLAVIASAARSVPTATAPTRSHPDAHDPGDALGAQSLFGRASQTPPPCRIRLPGYLAGCSIFGGRTWL
jgi:hypothetical protein